MGTEIGGNFLQFLVRLHIVGQFSPTDGGLEMMGVGWFQGFHGDGHILPRTSLTKAPSRVLTKYDNTTNRPLFPGYSR